MEYARIVRPKDPKEQIAGLEFPTGEARVELVEPTEAGGKRRLFAFVEGRFPTLKTSLLKDAVPIPRDPVKGTFTYELELQDGTTTLSLTAVGVEGSVRGEKIRLEFPLYAEYLKGRPVAPKLLGLNLGVGITYLSYTDSRPSSNLTQIGITPKISFNRSFFTPRLDFAANAYITALTFANSQDVKMRLLGTNLRVGYVLPRPSEPWRVTLYAGYYFTTMFVSPELFGFSRMHGPQLFPALRYQFRNQTSLSFYVKYSPVFGAGGVLSPSNAELATGLGYALPLRNGHPITISLDVARLNLENLEGTGVNAAVTSFTLGAGYGF